MDVNFASLSNSGLQYAEYIVKTGRAWGGRLWAGLGGDFSESMFAVASDSRGQGALNFKRRQKGGIFERQLYLASHFVHEQQQPEGLLQVEVYRGQELFGGYFVAARLASGPPRPQRRKLRLDTDILKLFEVAEQGASADAEHPREVGGGITPACSKSGQNLHNPANPAGLHNLSLVTRGLSLVMVPVYRFSRAAVKARGVFRGRETASNLAQFSIDKGAAGWYNDG